jgi:carbonic anhydrase
VSAADELRRANELYARSFSHGDLAAPPRRRFAVVTCMDARLVPARFLGIEEGDAHVIRNAGGVVTEDTLRSLAISHHLLGTQEAFVIAHDDCGMLSIRDEELQDRLGTDMPFHTFDDLDESVRASLRRIRDSPLLPDSFTATGYVYDVRTGRLRDVV